METQIKETIVWEYGCPPPSTGYYLVKVKHGDFVNINYLQYNEVMGAWNVYDDLSTEIKGVAAWARIREELL